MTTIKTNSPTPTQTTASVESTPAKSQAADSAAGLVLIYAKNHEHLPSALPFIAPVISLGRDLENSLCIPESSVSRFHARIERQADGYWMMDNGSTNGTMVNGELIKTHLLEDQDVVRIGTAVFRYTSRNAYAFAAYPLDGPPLKEARPVSHSIENPLLIGGYQIDSLLAQMEKVAATNLSVVITGESGTGKELLAKEIHKHSSPNGPFQAINCAALPANLIESELFGYKKGAFTGANSDKEGLVKAANSGTLFLDEIGDMPLEAQSKLLRVLQEKEVLPIGSTVAQKVNVRIVCATHRDLNVLVTEGKFRGDLLARLREFLVELPPLRDRREDLYRLVRHFLAVEGKLEMKITVPFMLALAHYSWPYNIRELESAVKLSLALTTGNELDLSHLPSPIQKALTSPSRTSRPSRNSTVPAPFQPTKIKKTPTEKELRKLLEQNGGNVAAVGRILNKERMQIHRWMKKYNIDPNEYR